MLPYGVDATNNLGGGKRGAGGMDLFDSPVTTALEAQLNEARRVKRGRDLRRERHTFLSRLTQEREERVLLETWAASKVQALFRGFLVRPRPPRPRPRRVLTPAESNRRLVADLQAILAHAGLSTIPGLGLDGRKTLEGSDWGRGRALPLRGEAMRGPGVGRLRRSRSRKHRAFEDEMGTRITKVVRGYLGRKRFERRWAAWNEERRRAGALRIQRAWRGYRKRKGWHELESGVTDQAAAKIQARWRGMACRMELARRGKEDALWKRKTVSAITIQAAARRRFAVARYGPGLTLGAARRQREARAAAEAARPRRRWNRGGPTAATGPAGPGVGNTAAAMGGAGFQVEGSSPRQPGEHARVAGTEDRVGGVGGARGKGAAAAKALPRRRAGSTPVRPMADSAAVVGKDDGAITSIGSAGVFRGRKATPTAATTEVADVPSSTPSKKQEYERQEPAHGWEHGSRKAETTGVAGASGTNSSTATSSTSDHNEAAGSSNAPEEEDGRGETGSGREGGGGVRFAPEVDQSRSEIARRASKAASLVFVQDSIHAAVVNARRFSVLESAVASTPRGMEDVISGGGDLSVSGGVDGAELADVREPQQVGGELLNVGGSIGRHANGGESLAVL